MRSGCRPKMVIIFHAHLPYIDMACPILKVSSAVPEGKGVSSSAALEVATMSAIAAAYGKACHSLASEQTLKEYGPEHC